MQDHLQITNHAHIFENGLIDEGEAFAFNTSQVESFSNICSHALFQARALEMPETTAVRDQDGKLDYMQLNNLSNQLARHLRDLGIKPGDPVGIKPDFSVDMAVVLLAVFKAGGYLVSLQEQGKTRPLPEDAPIVLSGECQAECQEVREQAICLDRDWHDIAEQPGANLAVAVEPYHPACRAESGKLLSHGLLAYRATQRIAKLGLTPGTCVCVDSRMGLEELLGHCLTGWLCGATLDLS